MDQLPEEKVKAIRKLGPNALKKLWEGLCRNCKRKATARVLKGKAVRLEDFCERCKNNDTLF